MSKIPAQLCVHTLTSSPRSSRSSSRFPREQRLHNSFPFCIKFHRQIRHLLRVFDGVMGIASLIRRKYMSHTIPIHPECQLKKRRYSRNLNLVMWNLRRHGARSYGALLLQEQ